MALVRRITVLAQTPAAKAVESAIVQVAKHAMGGAAGPVPHQQGVGSGTEPVGSGAEPVGTGAAAASGTPISGDVAASSPQMPAGWWALVISFGLVVAAGVGAYLLPAGRPFQVSSAASAYGGLLVFAAAIERVLEPFSHWLPGRHAGNRYEAAVAAMLNNSTPTTLATVATAKAQTERGIVNRTVLMWGLATSIATVAASTSGFYLLRMVVAPGSALSVPPWVDALVTGLIVGSGTKPLHDLITKAQTPKNPPPDAAA